MGSKKSVDRPSSTITNNTSEVLFNDIANLINEAKQHVAHEYNSTQALLCWLIGKRIDEEVLKTGRAEYGEAIITSLANELSLAYGKGYSRPNLFRMIKFARQFPNREIVSTLSRQLSWSHFVIICSIDDNLKRDFYAEMCRVQRWSVRALQKQLNGMLYERTALSKKPESVIEAQLDKLKNNAETPNLRVGNLKPAHIIRLGQEFGLSRPAINMAVNALSENLAAAKKAIAEAHFGSNVLKNKLINLMEKRWNGTFALIGKTLSKKP